METPNVLLNQHKLSIFRPYDITELLKILDESRENIKNLEFQNFTFSTDVTLAMWKEYGSRISSIRFIDCFFDDENITALILNCINLTRLSWNYGNLTSRDNSFYSDNALSNLVKSNVTRNSLKAISISVNDSNFLSKDTLFYLFSIYKNIEEFSIDFQNKDIHVFDKATSESQPSEMTSWQWLILHRLIASTDSVISVNLSHPFSQIYRGFVIRSAIPMFELLRSADSHLDSTMYKPDNLDNFIDFCVRRKNLQTVHLILNMEADETDPVKEEFTVRFSKSILQSCPKIRELKLNIDPSYNTLLLDEELFTLLVDSSLETFELRCEEMKMSESLSVHARQSSLKKNTTLRRLFLKVNNQETTVLFLKHFTQLVHLEVINAEDDVLQAIWKYQPNLTSLQLLNVVPYTWGFTGHGDESHENYDVKQNTGISISRLKNLQYLNIEAIEPDWNATDDIFDHFIFPELRFLDLEIMDNSGITTTMMAAIEKNVPMVEAIILRYYNEVPFDVWKHLCNQMKKLRYLAIYGDSSIESQYSDEEYLNLFSDCPTLRFLIHNHSNGREVYYYNVVQKKVLKKDLLSWAMYEDSNGFDHFSVKKIQV